MVVVEVGVVTAVGRGRTRSSAWRRISTRSSLKNIRNALQSTRNRTSRSRGSRESSRGITLPLEILEIELEILGDIPRGVVGVGEVLEGVGSPPKLVADSSAATAASTRYSMVKSEFHPMLPSSSYNQLQPRSSSNITLRAVRTRCVAGSNTRSALTPSS
jgi:hypothetical protein